MNKLILSTTLVTFIGCGQIKDLGQGLIDAPSTIAKDFLRIDEDDNVDIQQQNNLSSLENRIALLEKTNKLQRKLIDNNTSSIDGNSDAIENIEIIVNDLESQIEQVEQDLIDFEQDTEDDINDILARLDALEDSVEQLEDATESGIAEVVDPCGDFPGHQDEVLLVLNSGEIIAYFQKGNRRMLTVLGDGNFQTTDKQKCNFSIVNNEIID